MAAGAKIKRKQTSPKGLSSGISSLDNATSGKVSGGTSGVSTSLKYGGSSQQQQNFLEKYSTKTRNKIGHAVSAQQPG